MAEQVNQFNSPIWAETISRYLKKKKELHAMSFPLLAQRLEAIGVDQNKENLSAKFNRGTLGAQLFVASLMAMDESSIDLNELKELYREVEAGL